MKNSMELFGIVQFNGVPRILQCSNVLHGFSGHQCFFSLCVTPIIWICQAHSLASSNIKIKQILKDSRLNWCTLVEYVSLT